MYTDSKSVNFRPVKKGFKIGVFCRLKIHNLIGKINYAFLKNNCNLSEEENEFLTLKYAFFYTFSDLVRLKQSTVL